MELAVGAEDEVDAGGLPLEVTGLAAAAFEGVLGLVDGLPLRTHLDQVDEEVVGELALTVGEPGVDAEHDETERFLADGGTR